METIPYGSSSYRTEPFHFFHLIPFSLRRILFIGIMVTGNRRDFHRPLGFIASKNISEPFRGVIEL